MEDEYTTDRRNDYGQPYINYTCVCVCVFLHNSNFISLLVYFITLTLELLKITIYF